MSETTFLSGRVRFHAGDCLDVLRTLPDASIDSCVTDPPYALVSITKRFGKPGSAPVKIDDPNKSNCIKAAYARASAGFMGKQWDTGDRAFAVEFWAEVLRVLKPGGHVLAFSGTRTYHRLACAVEDAGFEIRDQIGWAFGSGFPKSHDVSKGIDRLRGAQREVVGIKVEPNGRNRLAEPRGVADRNTWGANGSGFRESVEKRLVTAPATDEAARWEGWGTALKPAWEPIVVARRPLQGTVAQNVLAHGTGALNIDGCRVATDEIKQADRVRVSMGYHGGNESSTRHVGDGTSSPLGRWPANLIHDGSEEVLQAFPETGPAKTGVRDPNGTMGYHGGASGLPGVVSGHEDAGGSSARFFYQAKADSSDRIGSRHPTVKPVDLMRYLVRLVTPPGGVILDPFAGTGTTGQAAYLEGFSAVLVEREEEYQADIARRMELVLAGPDEKARAIVKAKGKVEDAGPLFGGIGE